MDGETLVLHWQIDILDKAAIVWAVKGAAESTLFGECSCMYEDALIERKQ